ncbi:MAG TPA: hypothetical protein VFZ61_03695 [Polyangiales bacterium]
MSLSRYKCHKEVNAGKILEIVPGGLEMIVEHDGGIRVVHFVTREWFDKHQPKAGGYLVQYDDGYESYSPAAAFEAGYSAIYRP